jgi:dihydroorotase
MPYDLLLKGGHVLDPGQGLDGEFDIAITDGKIAAVAPNIAETEATKVVRVNGKDRYVIPGLIDLHTHVAYGATTAGVGMGSCDPDVIGVHSGVTTLLDAGSVGVANFGVFRSYILPKATTRIFTFVNAGSFAHTMPGFGGDFDSFEEINRDAIAKCVEANPGLVQGIKLRAVGGLVNERGEDVAKACLEIAREHNIPLMVHIGDPGVGGRQLNAERLTETTRYLLRNFAPGDILTHLCTPSHGSVLDESQNPYPELDEAHKNGVVLDSALGMGNFGYIVAEREAQIGVYPDTISSDLTAGGQTFHSLLECMSKFMAIGYSLSDVVKMTTTNPAKSLNLSDTIGAIKVGQEADISVIDQLTGDFKFRDTTKIMTAGNFKFSAPDKGEFLGNYGLVPVQTVKAGELFAPHWGTHPWGWAPEAA